MQEEVKVSWVFDVISPFAYLAFPQLSRLPAHASVGFVPVLFAGLLQHFGQLGPAEIPSKRRFTYRFVLWRARQLGLPMRMPPAHPFREGRDVADPAVIAALAGELGVADVQAAVDDNTVKQHLRDNTAWASARGVFGVPTLVIGKELFWGHDAFDMALEYLRHPDAFRDPDMQAADTLPIGATRKR